MTVYSLMPVHNRIDATQAMVGMLRAQQCDEDLQIVIVDDGSSDGTSEWLATQTDITVIKGDGTLWWGGAIHSAFQVCNRLGKKGDWVLLVNDDTEIRSDFVSTLLEVARKNKRSIVGTMLRNVAPPHDITSVGPDINTSMITIADRPLTKLLIQAIAENDTLPASAISGRGALYPLQALRDVNGMRPRFLPHYQADYELSLRAKEQGWDLLLATGTAVYSTEEYGNQQEHSGWRNKYFSVKSPSYLPAMWAFWWRASSIVERVSLPYRMAIRAINKPRSAL